MISFDERYGRMNGKVRSNVALVREAFAISEKKELRFRDGSENGGTYFSVGKINNIYVGIDLSVPHNFAAFNRILANMRLIYEVSEGKADLPCVYAQLRSMAGHNERGIISEDMSRGGRYKIRGSHLSEGNAKLLRGIFNGNGSVEDAVFGVLRKRGKKKGEVIREPIVDLDHLDKVRPEYLERYMEYLEQYKSDGRFFIDD